MLTKKNSKLPYSILAFTSIAYKASSRQDCLPIDFFIDLVGKVLAARLIG
jgi:hypothetical protein